MSWVQRLRQWWSGPGSELHMAPPPETTGSPLPEIDNVVPIEPHHERRRKRQNAHVATQAVTHGGF